MYSYECDMFVVREALHMTKHKSDTILSHMLHMEHMDFAQFARVGWLEWLLKWVGGGLKPYRNARFNTSNWRVHIY